MSIIKTVSPVGTAVQRGGISSKPSDKNYFFAGRSLSFKQACHHFLVAGATGSGKSITLNLLMQSVLPKIGRGDVTETGKPIKRRAVVYDSKADLVSLLGPLCGGMERLKILNPLDARFTPWDISQDITTETDANEFAAMLIAKNEKESSPYFSDTARSLVAGVIKRFIMTSRPQKDAWTLRDVILAFESKSRLKHILDHDDTRYLMDHFSEDNAKNFAGVKSTADTSLGIYRPVAALIESAENESISLDEWVENHESVLVLGNHEKSREATDTLNRLILHRLSKSLISREGVRDDGSDETWIFLDELREAGALRGLRQLLLRGRSKGVSVAMGFQDVEGIFSAYGDHEGAEIIGAAHNTIVLHINPSAPKTAQWCSDVFSSRRDQVRSTSNTTGEKGMSQGVNATAQLIPNVYPIQFVELPLPTPEVGLQFYSFTNTDGYREFTYPWSFLEKDGFFSLVDAEAYPTFNIRKARDAYRLKPWEEEDYLRLGIDEVKSNAPKDTTETKDATLLLEESAPSQH